MTIRRPFQTQLLSAWRASISDHYLSRQVNSERSLQASLWANLILELPKNRRTFIEPRIYNSGGNKIPKLYPDLVICNSRNVIAVIELKYTPCVKPRHGDDLRKLNQIATLKSSLYVENSRYLGRETHCHRYTFADNVVFGWASIHRRQSQHNDAKLLALDYPLLSDCFFELHAQTDEGSDPIVGLTSN